MAVPTVVATNTGTGASGAAQVVVMPTWTFASGDMLLVQFYGRTSYTITSSGWTEITGAHVTNTDALAWMWKYAASGDSATSVTFTLSNSTAVIWGVSVVRGAASSSPIGAVSANSSAGGTGTTATANGITTTGTDSLLLIGGSSDDAWTWGSPVGGTSPAQVYNFSTGAVGGSAARSVALFREGITTSGTATGSRTMTASAGNADLWEANQIEILAAATSLPKTSMYPDAIISLSNLSPNDVTILQDDPTATDTTFLAAP